MSFKEYCKNMKELHDLDARQAIAENIKRLRSEKGLTQIQLSEKAKMTQSALSKIENGLVWPDHGTLNAIAAVFRCEETEITSHPDLLDAFKKLKKIK